MDLDPSVRVALAPILKTAVVLSTSKTLAYRQLAIRTDAQQERAKRQSTTRRTLPSCSIMTVADARGKIAERKAEEKRKRNVEAGKEERKKEKEEKEKEKAEHRERKKREREERQVTKKLA